MFFQNSEAKEVKHQILKHFISGKVLDVGYASFPSPIAQDFYGIDMQERQAPVGYKEVKKVDLNREPIPYEKDSFDTVIAIDTVEHLMNPLSFFLEVNRVLRLGGKFIFCVPNPYFWREIIVNIFMKASHVPSDKQHINFPTRHIVRNLFHWSGLTLRKEIGFAFPIPKTNLVLETKLLRKMPGLAYENIYMAEKTNENPKFSVVTKIENVGMKEI